jgi:hypothetical protein
MFLAGVAIGPALVRAFSGNFAPVDALALSVGTAVFVAGVTIKRRPE